MTNNIETVPHSKQAEQAFIGSVILDASVSDRVEISPSDFFIIRHKWIFEAVIALKARGVYPDFVTLGEELDIRGQLKEIGGPAYISKLVARSPSSLGASDYAEIIKDKARRRRALEVANDLAKAAYDEETPLDDTIPSLVNELAIGVRPKRGARPVGEFIPGLIEEVEERAKNPNDTWGITTGFLDFDRIFGGLQLGEALYIAGKPGVGKSILAVQIGVNASEQEPGAIYSLEMKERQLIRRTVSAVAQVPTRNLKSGKMLDDDWSPFYQACETVAGSRIHLSDEAELTIPALRADLAYLKSRHQIKWFVLDYLYLLRDGIGRLDSTERTEVLSGQIKGISKALDLASITVNSVTKDGMKNGTPTMDQLRGSGQVLHDADVVAFLIEHPSEDNNLRRLVFTKVRDAESVGSIDLLKRPSWPAFENVVARELNIPGGNGRELKEPALGYIPD